MNKYLLLAVMLYSSTAFSNGVWTPAGNITAMDEYGHGLRVYGLDFSANPANCQQKGSAMMTGGDSAVKNRLNSVLLSAFLASKKVQIKLM